MVEKKQKKIKVLIAINDFLVGGAQKQLIQLFRTFNHEKFEFGLVTFFDFSHKQNFFSELPKDLPVSRLNFSGFADIQSWARFAAFLWKEKPDIIVSNLFFSNTVTRVLKPFLGYQVITVEHNTYTDKKPMHIWLDRLLSLVTYRIVAVSRTVAEFTITQEHLSKQKMHVIHNGTDVAEIQKQFVELPSQKELKQAVGFDSQKRIIINVARLTDQKNHALLIKSFAQFSKHHPEYALVILGEGSLMDDLTELARVEGVEQSVFLLGNKTDVLNYYKASDFFASTSHIEGLSISYLEAFACGLPLVATRTAGTDEILEEGKNGFFIPEKTVEATASALEKMTSVDLEQYGAQAKAMAARFDIRVTALEYEKLFEECYYSTHES